MSHIVTIKTEVRDPAAVAAACLRLGLPEPVHGTAKLFEGEATGLLVRLPDWLYPAVVHIEHRPGPVRQLQRGAGAGRSTSTASSRRYAVEKARIEARKRGHSVVEQALADGSVKLTITGRRCVLSKVIEITVSPKGETTVQTRGFAGGGVPRGQPVRRAGPRPADRRDAHRRVLPGPAGRPGAAAVAVSDVHPSRPTQEATGPCSTPTGGPSSSASSLGIAEAMREEFGADVDAHPGGPGNEAGQVNRAYRVVGPPHLPDDRPAAARTCRAW